MSRNMIMPHSTGYQGQKLSLLFTIYRIHHGRIRRLLA